MQTIMNESNESNIDVSRFALVAVCGFEFRVSYLVTSKSRLVSDVRERGQSR